MYATGYPPIVASDGSSVSRTGAIDHQLSQFRNESYAHMYATPSPYLISPGSAMYPPQALATNTATAASHIPTPTLSQPEIKHAKLEAAQPQTIHTEQAVAATLSPYATHPTQVPSYYTAYPTAATITAAASSSSSSASAAPQMQLPYPGYQFAQYAAPYPTHVAQPQMNPLLSLNPMVYHGENIGKRSLSAITPAADSHKKQKLFKDATKRTSEKKKKSKYRGVFWHTRGKAWVSSIMVNGKTTHLGYYDDEVEAARVYDKEAIRLKGITCAVNFPDSIERFGGKNADKDAATTMNKVSTRHERKRAERISKYRGVCWNKCNSSWKACIKIDGKNKHIGYFSNQVEAAKAYDVKALQVRGPNAKLNFPAGSS